MESNGAIPDELIERIVERLESRRKGPAWVRRFSDSLVWFRDRLHIILITAFSLPAFIVMFRIAVMDTDIGGRTPAATNSASSEAMVQLAQWTITTVLALGGALIGLNWYQGERRYEHDRGKLEERIQTLEEQTTDRLSYLEFANTATVQMLIYQAVATALGNPDDLDFVSRAINYFRTSDSVPMRRAAASILIEYAKVAVASHPTNYKRSNVPVLRDFIPELSQQFPELGSVLAQALAGDTSEE